MTTRKCTIRAAWPDTPGSWQRSLGRYGLDRLTDIVGHTRRFPKRVLRGNDSRGDAPGQGTDLALVAPQIQERTATRSTCVCICFPWVPFHAQGR